MTETNSNAFQDIRKSSDRFSELLESDSNVSSDKRNVRITVNGELRKMLEQVTAGYTVGLPLALRDKKKYLS